MLSSIVALIFGYFCGAIPFGLLLTRFAGTADLRSIGSGNIGATNVLRTGRKDLAAATLLLDALKGLVAVLVTNAFAPGLPPLFAATGAFLGHVFPVWLGFRGGKGVATFLGCLFGLDWHVGLVFIVIWVGVAAATRYSSAGALAASVAAPIALLMDGHRAFAILFVFLTLALWYLHRANIARLAAGTESRIGGSKTAGDTT